MAVDITKLTDDELNALDDDAIRKEKSIRKGNVTRVESKTAIDEAITASAKLAGVRTEQDDGDEDGMYVVLDLSSLDDSIRDRAMSDLLGDGALFKSATKVRIHANRAVKEGGYLEKLVTLL